MSSKYVVSVDVGTSSVRAALVNLCGKIIKKAVHKIHTWNPEPEHYEQSSEDIWNAVCFCVRDATAGIEKIEIVALSFDATCSLVVLGPNGRPLSISKKFIENQRNVILWMDHRAQKQTDQINATKHDLLKYVGGKVSVEMQMPKIKWLKENCQESTWPNIWRIFDLADYLTWRATGSNTRSLCTVVCKWNYDGIQMCWDKDYLRQINLDDLLRNKAEMIGNDIKEPGVAIGNGLKETAAQELGLLKGIVVSTSLIDGHAGALGLFGCKAYVTGDNNEYLKYESPELIEGKLAIICGTSTCHMSLVRQSTIIEGVWGPYRDAIIKDYYLNEAGQSTTGILLDHIVQNHPSTEKILLKLKNTNQNIYIYLNELLVQMSLERGLDDPCYLTKDVHVWPDFHGNRSPLSDPHLRGMITGLNLDVNEESLAILYLAFLQALAYGTRHILDTLTNKRGPFHSILFCGGLVKNALYIQTHADICQLNCIVPLEEDMVLIGTAMLGASAANVYDNIQTSSQSMGGRGLLIKPTESKDNRIKNYHDCKYKVFMKMLSNQREYQRLMSNF